jgi:hypothetical protein
MPLYSWYKKDDLLDFKILHLRYATKDPHYKDHLEAFFKNICSQNSNEFGAIIANDSWINTLFTSHSMRHYGEEEALNIIRKWRTGFDQINDIQGTYVQSSRLKSLFHHHFIREKFSECLNVAKQALTLSECARKPSYDRYMIDGCELPNSLNKVFWKYLMIRTAVEDMKTCKKPTPAMCEELLSVVDPRSFFSNEENYCLTESDDLLGIYHITPYGESLLETTEWADALRLAVNKGILEKEQIDTAKSIIRNLEELQSETTCVDSAY